MAKILLIETATEICSMGIATDGVLVALHEAAEDSRHSEQATLLIQECVKTSGIALADLDAVAVSIGPGSYTSLRVGISVAKGICFALGKPLLAIPTLQSLAYAAKKSLPSDFSLVEIYFVPMIDARRSEVYTAIFDHNLTPLSETAPLILSNNLFDDLAEIFSGFSKKNVLVFSGNGSEKTGNGFFFKNTVLSSEKKCSAAHLATLAESAYLSSDYQSVLYLNPIYLKNPNITIGKKSFF